MNNRHRRVAKLLEQESLRELHKKQRTVEALVYLYQNKNSILESVIRAFDVFAVVLKNAVNEFLRSFIKEDGN